MKLLMVVLLALGGLFNAGCTAQQRADAVQYVTKEAFDALKAEIPGMIEKGQKMVQDQLDGRLKALSTEVGAASATGQKLAQGLAAFDVNHDGIIDADEVKALVVSVTKANVELVAQGKGVDWRTALLTAALAAAGAAAASKGKKEQPPKPGDGTVTAGPPPSTAGPPPA